MTDDRRIRWHSRLYLRIYLAVLGIVAVLVLMLAGMWYEHTDPRKLGVTLQAFAPLVSDVLPPIGAADTLQQAALDRWQPRTDLDLALYSAAGHRMAMAGKHDWPPRLDDAAAVGVNPTDLGLRLADGRLLLVRGRGRMHPRPVRLMIFFSVIAALVGLGCYPLVRRLTRRLEVLQQGVKGWATTGNVSTRVRVEGNDEVAAVATSFNHAAERIESLLRAQKALVSNASHELRSPLARIRMAVELLPKTTPDSLRAEFARNIAELDQLAGEILLASRLDAQEKTMPAFVPLDFKALVEEECAAANATVQAEPSKLHGDPMLLRRLVRNLLENASRHGCGALVEVSLTARPNDVELLVRDHGPGIPETERERVFEPFYRLHGASEAAGGVGLGLSLVRQIAAAHGGTAECLSSGVSGGCFLVRLPWQCQPWLAKKHIED